MLNISRALLLLIFCISQGSVATCSRCGAIYGTSLVANSLLSPAVKEFLKSGNITQSSERISSGTFFMAHSVLKQNLLLLRWRILALPNANKRITRHCNATPCHIIHADVKLLKLLCSRQTNHCNTDITLTSTISNVKDNNKCM